MHRNCQSSVAVTLHERHGSLRIYPNASEANGTMLGISMPADHCSKPPCVKAERDRGPLSLSHVAVRCGVFFTLPTGDHLLEGYERATAERENQTKFFVTLWSGSLGQVAGLKGLLGLNGFGEFVMGISAMMQRMHAAATDQTLVAETPWRPTDHAAVTYTVRRAWPCTVPTSHAQHASAWPCTACIPSPMHSHSP
ncbi:uncharacterized protein LOC120138565 [Hibiscus syriacus]|uniref:uncharacterized protein LOC120138565 n=1 Tax=Hibiscus syriacus TaxID=106335 RepID=UPI001924FD49|nr:uncharacterized protein LOC120138565 [Hibiscus syriacus]